MNGPGDRSLRVSVVMATCNGSRFVAAQLQSILAQTRPPDEVLVFDDASTDDTAAVVTSLLDASPVPGRVVINESRVGISANFEQAIRGASGDVIALADQDDVWHPAKLATIVSAFTRRPDLGATFTDATLIDGEGRPLQGGLWWQVGMTAADVQRFAQGRGLEVLLRQNVVTGATMAFHARLRDLVVPFPDTGFHDAWIGLLAAAVSPVEAIAEPLIAYRLHGGNAAGLPARRLLARIAARRRRGRVHESAAAFYEAALIRLDEHGALNAPGRSALAAKNDLLRFRQGLSRNPLRRLVPVTARAMHGDYRRFSREGPRSAVYDVLYG